MKKEGLVISKLSYIFLRLVLGAIFLYSGISKISNPQSFSIIIDAYGILPEPLTLPCAYILSGLEIIAGLGIVLDILGSLSLLTGLLVLFMIILGYGIHMGLDVDCGCFGPEDVEGQAFHGLRGAFNRDMAMLAGIFYLYVYRFVRKTKPKKIVFNPLYFNSQRRTTND